MKQIASYISILIALMFKLHCTGGAFAEMDRDLVVVDVSYRWGFADQLANQLDKFTIYGFDPDPEECNRLKKRYKSPKVTFFPIGLLDREGTSTLYVTKQPACSSIYPPNLDLIQSCPSLQEVMIDREIEIEHTTLDSWSNQFSPGPIDYIKIDTQGSELLILKGGKESLKNVRVLEVEVEFNPIYEGQPLFSDVDAFLREQGFVLWRLKNLSHYGKKGENKKCLGKEQINYDNISQQIDIRGGQLHWADAFYVKKEIAESKITNPMQMRRDIILLDSLKLKDLSSRLKEKIDSYYSQFLQDGFVHETFFKNKKKGIFVDIGAAHPTADSNSYFFESILDWDGICIDPHPSSFSLLKKERKCKALNIGITGWQEGTAEFLQYEKLWGLSGLSEKFTEESLNRLNRMEKEVSEEPKVIQVNLMPINKVLEDHELFHIDFLSLDIEGGELEVLEAIDFNRFFIDVIAVENNWEDPIFKEAKNSSIRKYMEENSYRYITRLGVDEIYKNLRETISEQNIE